MPRKSRKSNKKTNKKTNKRTGGTSRMPFQSPKYKRAAEELEQNQQNQQNQEQNSTPPYDYSQENNPTLSVLGMTPTSIHEQQQQQQEQDTPAKRYFDKLDVEDAIDEMEANAVKSRKKRALGKPTSGKATSIKVSDGEDDITLGEIEQTNNQQQNQQQPAPPLDKDTLKIVKSFFKSNGGKKVRKHRGIVQTGGKAGKLRKGYKYTGRRLKNGQAEIKKVKSKK